MATRPLAATVAEVRAFNRFYTRMIGLLDEGQRAGFPPERITLTQLRLLHEIAHRSDLTARVLADELGLDPGYLSRLLNGFERRGLVRRRVSVDDGREKRLRITASGRRLVRPFIEATEVRISALVQPLEPTERLRLLAAMTTIRQLLGRLQAPLDPAAAGAATAAGGGEDGCALRLRPHRPGDIGWVIERHGALYHAEYGWNSEFEALVARIGARFLQRFDPAAERAWIVERALPGPDPGLVERVGSAFVVRASATTAKLRLVLVEPRARGLGIGRRLVDEAIRFATARGYRKLTLWTNDCLHAARAIYVAAGFRRVRAIPHQSFGQALVGEFWALKLPRR